MGKVSETVQEIKAAPSDKSGLETVEFWRGKAFL